MSDLELESHQALGWAVSSKNPARFNHLAGFFTGPNFLGAVPKLVHHFVQILVDVLQTKLGLVNQIGIVGAVPA